ncbi:MAG: phage tail sheath subtilisin-like domain-containing protein, partial [Lachnospiraceae bacterium]
TVEFASGEGETESLADALNKSENFKVEVKEGKEKAIIAPVSQAEFEKGTDPQVTVEDYANAFSEVEPYIFNTICVDTEDPQVLSLLHEFVDRIYNDGYLVQAVVAEKSTVALEQRIKNAAAFNDEKMIYVLNAHVAEKDEEIDGYQTAARIAGMVGAAPSTSSLTHTTISGFTELKEKIKKTDIEKAEENGCLVLSYNKNNQVWIDNAINTLVTLPENMDKGWKKIRRVNTRFELMDRLNQKNDDMIGKIDVTDTATVIIKLQEVGDAMKKEGKLVYFAVTESENKKADGDSAWFDYDVIDKDSLEHIYGTFKFRYNTNME